MKIKVPYYSQYLDVTDELWQPRACGVACLKMLLEAKGASVPILDEMIAQGCAIGVHGEYGWKHDGLVALAKQYGEKISRAEWRKSEGKTPDELNDEGIIFIISKLKTKKPVIISAIRKFKESDKFHMVILTGFREECREVSGFYYNDPDARSKKEGQSLFVPIDILRAKWRKMAIF